MRSFQKPPTLLITAVCLLGLNAAPTSAADKVDFNRQIRSILADNCYQCHGPDAGDVQGDLRLDLRDDVLEPADSGARAIVPGKPGSSELISRIFSNDESVLMPPPDSHKSLKPQEKQLLKQWISEGAEYADHWAFTSPAKGRLPAIQNAPWIRNEIDQFVLSRLEKAGLKPSAEATRETLIRRVSLDLRGFPPTIDEIDKYLADKSPDAYEAMVDRMLSSEHFGEKMARIWMDLARYGDTNGYHYDSTRQVWMWRDWVIQAYNNNMPFDQFTIEQLGGDLIENSTISQRIASGFNRNTRYNEEGGADPDEWRVEYAKDRTRTLGQVWLGMTVGCAECHSHKYDPISHKEFYQLYAFFNSLEEPGAQGHRQKYPPLLEVPTSEQESDIARLESQVAKLKKKLGTELADFQYKEPTDLATAPQTEPVEALWIDDDVPEGAVLQGNGTPAWNWVQGDPQQVHHGKRATLRTGKGLNQHFFTGAKPLVVKENDVLFAWVRTDPKNPPKTIQLQFNDGSWEHRAFWGERKGYGGKESPSNHRVGDLPPPGVWTRLEVPANNVNLKPGSRINGWAFTQFDGTVSYDQAGTINSPADSRHLKSLALWTEKAAKDTSLPGPVKNALKLKPSNRSEKHQNVIRNYFIEHVFEGSRSLFDGLHKQIADSEAQLKKVRESVPFQLVSVELNEPRPAFMLTRGEFNKPADKVQRAVPSVFPAMRENAPLNRLGLAQWLVTGEHPMTARVTVNRYWAQLFGSGLVESIGDFGHLGSFPTHPALLDWLAVEFVESGWNTKYVIKKMVMSATYRQSAVNDHRHDAIDPNNKLLWRAPRFRLPAEEIRDSALQIAGMLNPTIGGPPIFPYQPADYYKGKKGGWTWDINKGNDQYRRGMYTFWRRTTPYPTFVIFDAPDRSECIVARARTNTPLQALATMNDPQFVEAARVFAQQILAINGNQEERLRTAFRRTVTRQPSDAELAVLSGLLRAELDFYSEHKEDAARLVSVGQFTQPEKMDPVQHAAWTAIANALLNLDETINRE